jgi:hypothetical protein
MVSVGPGYGARWMRRVALMLSMLSMLALAAAPAGAGAAEPPPGAAISDSLEYITRVPASDRIVEGKFDRVDGRKVLVTTGRYGFRTYDVSDPERPQPLDTLQPAEILGEFGYWQDEDMTLDTRRKLIIGALDPRHDDVDQASCPGIGTSGAKNRNPNCNSGFYVISYANPADLRQVGDFVELPAGHTASCIEGCRYIWTGGPARRDDLPALYPDVWTAFTPGARGDGRPIWVTNLKDPEHPVVYDRPIDLYRNDGASDYSHDVQVDARGIAWVSGRGGILGYATSGKHRDPYTDRVRRAKPWDPVLVAGGGVGGVNQPQTDFMHNSLRPTGGATRAAGVKHGNVLIGTEEDFTEPCDKSGRVVLSDITDSLGGEPAVGSTPEHPYRMKPLDTFHPAQDTPETTDPDLDCSAHYFELSGSTLGVAWYGQGLRLVDVSNARDVRQIGYYRVTGTDPATNPSSLSWDLAWNGRYVYLFDMDRGIEVLKLRAGTSTKAVGGLRSVAAPSHTRDRYAAVPASGLTRGSLVCPLFRDSAASRAAKRRSRS